MTDEDFRFSESHIIEICKDLLPLNLVGMLEVLDKEIEKDETERPREELAALRHVVVAIRGAQGMAGELRDVLWKLAREKREAETREQMEREFAEEWERCGQLERDEVTRRRWS